MAKSHFWPPFGAKRITLAASFIRDLGKLLLITTGFFFASRYLVYLAFMEFYC